MMPKRMRTALILILAYAAVIDAFVAPSNMCKYRTLRWRGGSDVGADSSRAIRKSSAARTRLADEITPITALQSMTTAATALNSFLLTDGLSAAIHMGKIGDHSALSIPGPLSTLRPFFIVATAAILGIIAIYLIVPRPPSN